MFPEILKLGPLTIRTYGLLVALGMFAGLHYILFRAKQKNIPEGPVLDLILSIIVAGLLGARLAYVLFNLSFFVQHPLDIFRVWEGGLVFYGGFIASAVVAVFYIRRHPVLPFWQLMDIMAPALALGHFFGRLGCFFAGCCYGTAADGSCAVQFTDPRSLAPLGIPLHPVQLYEAAGNLALFFFLDYRNRRSHREGATAGTYLLLYAVLRFFIEFLRGDDRGGFLLGLSPSQIMALLLAGAGAAVLAKKGPHGAR